MYLLFMFMIGSRLFFRIFENIINKERSYSDKTRVFIYGAGQAGKLLLEESQRNPLYEDYSVIGFIDDDPNKRNHSILGIKIFGSDDLPRNKKSVKADELWVSSAQIGDDKINAFVKYIGADNKRAGEMAKSHLESLGIKTKLFYPSVTTEIGKLFDTSYYALCIAWHGEMKKICDVIGANFEEAVVDFNKTYNEGYKKIGKKNVIRPVLYAPKEGITGHCLIPNAKILKFSRQNAAE